MYFFINFEQTNLKALGCLKLNILEQDYKHSALQINSGLEALTLKKTTKTLRRSLPYGELFFERRDYWNTPYKFNAKELDAETGMYYYGARYYTPEVSIWLSVDPLADKYPSMSSYMYCAGNPVRLIDPDGMKILPTDETTGEAIDQHVNSFSTKKMSGNDLFGIVKQKDGVLKSSLVLSDKKFLKRAEKSGLTDEQQQAALDFYKALMANETISLRSVNEGESQSDFFSKGIPLDGSLEGMPEFHPNHNPIMDVPDETTNIATNRSIMEGFSKGFYFSKNWSICWDAPNEEDNNATIVFLSNKNSISSNHIKAAFSIVSKSVIPYVNWTKKEIKYYKKSN